LALFDYMISLLLEYPNKNELSNISPVDNFFAFSARGGQACLAGRRVFYSYFYLYAFILTLVIFPANLP